MCLQTSSVVGTSRPNWDGDSIERSTVIRAARFVPDTETRYPIDIREYLGTSSNAVIRRVLDAVTDALPTAAARELFWSRRAGSFDHRVRSVGRYLAKTISYRRKKSRHLKEWLFPDETLAVGEGDCEDHAFLFGALLLASGVSDYVVRVALGKLRDASTGEATDHAWVMYKNEAGHWLVLDPLLYTADSARVPDAPPSRRSATASRTVAAKEGVHEYLPRFVFNSTHLWSIVDRGHRPTFEAYLDERRFWDEFDPSFAASVHNGIYDDALVGMDWADLQYVKAASLAIDANIAIYDPRDHFDDAYIDDAWARVETRLASGDLNDFALACHAIGDFYAHSSWGVFGARSGGVLQPLLDRCNPTYADAPDYSEDGRFPIQDPRFSVNEAVWGDKPRSAAVALWDGGLISGRYAQASDPHQGAAERLTYIPDELCGRDDYAKRAGLPHHNEIAVDSPTRAAAHRLYSDATYADAFRDRYGAAVAHVKNAYARWRAAGAAAAE